MLHLRHIRTGRRRSEGVVAGMLIVAALAACSSNGSGSASPRTGPVPRAVSSAISATTKMICATEVQGDLAQAVGRTIVHPVVPSWKNEVYSCAYEYSDGSFTLSVKQLPDAASTQFYFAHVAAQLGRVKPLDGLGEGAFTTRDDSVVVRKDEKVLVVDVRKLPGRFGLPSDSRANVAITVAATIMGCWTGA
jgi:hypothetical protein